MTQAHREPGAAGSPAGAPDLPVLPLDDPIGLPSAASAGSPALPDAGSAARQHASLESAEVLEGDAYAPEPRLGLFHRPLVRGITVHVLLSMFLGALAGVAWNLVVDLPEYQVDGQGRATTSERGLTQVFASDAIFCLIGVVLGVVIGVWAWKWFRRTGWPVVVIAILASLSSAFLCWWVGLLLGPRDFATRIAEAKAGQSVPVDFDLHAHVAVLVWPFSAVIPLLLLSSLTAEEQARHRHRGRPGRRAPQPSGDAPVTPVPEPAAQD
ncbi:hypothetical protein ACTQ49_01130 [Luteococcus sp. Sow4_B9]|uniref:hypothetical protein n=1 Tax=Luteococcus sp. Sow4_B9 TaxID=3438792 RepID=UPI003F9968E0